ncbi:MAG: hypothetical protein S0880_04850 [Actinomycetota bacterium]|nr:hypothetical protein [Actinomycetota bacterium]
MPALRSSLTRLLGRREGDGINRRLPDELVGELDDRPQIELSWAAPDPVRDGPIAAELADEGLDAAFRLGRILIAEQLSFAEADAGRAEEMRAAVAGMWTAATARHEAMRDAAPDGVLAALARLVPGEERTALLVEHACSAPFADPDLTFDPDDLRTAVRRIGAILRLPEGRVAEIEAAHRAADLPADVPGDARLDGPADDAPAAGSPGSPDRTGGLHLARDPDAIWDLDLDEVRRQLAKLRLTLRAVSRDDDGADAAAAIRDGLGERRSSLEAALVAERLLDEPDTTRREVICAKLELIAALIDRSGGD